MYLSTHTHPLNPLMGRTYCHSAMPFSIINCYTKARVLLAMLSLLHWADTVQVFFFFFLFITFSLIFFFSSTYFFHKRISYLSLLRFFFVLFLCLIDFCWFTPILILAPFLYLCHRYIYIHMYFMRYCSISSTFHYSIVCVVIAWRLYWFVCVREKGRSQPKTNQYFIEFIFIFLHIHIYYTYVHERTHFRWVV